MFPRLESYFSASGVVLERPMLEINYFRLCSARKQGNLSPKNLHERDNIFTFTPGCKYSHLKASGNKRGGRDVCCHWGTLVSTRSFSLPLDLIIVFCLVFITPHLYTKSSFGTCSRPRKSMSSSAVEHVLLYIRPPACTPLSLCYPSD